MKIAIVIAQVHVVPVEVPSLDALKLTLNNEEAVESLFDGVGELEIEPDVELGVKECPADVAPVLKLALVGGKPKFTLIIDAGDTQ